jgi:hypothetical protein
MTYLHFEYEAQILPNTSIDLGWTKICKATKYRVLEMYIDTVDVSVT